MLNRPISFGRYDKKMIEATEPSEKRSPTVLMLMKLPRKLESRYPVKDNATVSKKPTKKIERRFFAEPLNMC